MSDNQKDLAEWQALPPIRREYVEFVLLDKFSEIVAFARKASNRGFLLVLDDVTATAAAIRTGAKVLAGVDGLIAENERLRADLAEINKRHEAALDAIAPHLPDGELLLATDPATFLEVLAEHVVLWALQSAELAAMSLVEKE